MILFGSVGAFSNCLLAIRRCCSLSGCDEDKGWFVFTLHIPRGNYLVHHHKNLHVEEPLAVHTEKNYRVAYILWTSTCCILYLQVRGRDIVLTPTMVKIRELMEEILMWPCLEGNEGIIWGNFIGYLQQW